MVHSGCILASPEKNSHAHSDMLPKSVHMRHSIYYACEIWSSHAWPGMTELFHMREKILHVIKCMEKSSHIWQKIFTCITKFHMHVKCWCGELVFLPTLISHGSFFSHTFHMIFTHIALVVAARMGQLEQLRERTLCIMLVPHTKIGTISYLGSCNSCFSSIMQILKICWLLIMR